MRIHFINEVGISESDLVTLALGVQTHANKVAKAYGLEPVTITTTSINGDGSAIEPKTARVFITERRRASALAWRDTFNGVPIVYASLRASVKLFGVYTKPFVLKGRTISPARMRSGLISVLAHEVSELIVSPYMDNFTAPDSAGKSWRKEICDPVIGAYYFEQVGGVNCVFPDFVLPSFWDVNGKAPFSYLGTAKSPMTWGVGSYGWFRTGISRLLTRVKF